MEENVNELLGRLMKESRDDFWVCEHCGARNVEGQLVCYHCDEARYKRGG